MANHIDRAYERAVRREFDEKSRFVIISDCHRGCGSWGDNFAGNQNSYFAAMSYYFRTGYTYIELGDGDELWENRRFSSITAVHNHVFWLLSRFYKEGRLMMLYGNHDIDKRRKPGLMDKYYDATETCECSLFPGIRVYESVVLEYAPTGRELFLLHGHQADFFNDNLWMLSRFLVRYIWRPLEGIGMKAPTGGAPSERANLVCETLLEDWAEERRTMLIAGHTHRAAFPEPGEGFYLNDGSCVHPRCITAIEIDGGTISLVKWGYFTRLDGTLFVGREVLSGPYAIDDYFTGQRTDPSARCSLTCV